MRFHNFLLYSIQRFVLSCPRTNDCNKYQLFERQARISILSINYRVNRCETVISFKNLRSMDFSESIFSARAILTRVTRVTGYRDNRARARDNHTRARGKHSRAKLRTIGSYANESG